jgi:hypothetical protein
VLPKRSLELKKVGFNTGELEALAVRSKGSVIKSEFNNGTISAELPELFSGQTKDSLEKKYPLYNTMITFFIILTLMALYWILRKKISLD